MIRAFLTLLLVVGALIGMSGCATDLSKPIHPDNQAFLISSLAAAQSMVRWGVEEYTVAMARGDEAKMEGAWRRVEFALDAIVLTQERLGRTITTEEALVETLAKEE